MSVKLKDHVNLKAFSQHGFIYKGESGSQVYGLSVFSGKDNFWINPETKQWDCKNTGKSGGYQTFLKEIVSLCESNLQNESLIWLKKNRGLQRSTLRQHRIGFNPFTKCYTIPIFDAKKESVWDIKIFSQRDKKMIGTSGCTVGLFGWENMIGASKIWLCEGEWDKMAMHEILTKLNLSDKEVAVSVPGALTFKQEWVSLFQDKIVNVVYDFDHTKTINGIKRPGAGQKGTLKVYNMLKTTASSMSFVHWPQDSEDGFDVRDLLVSTKHHGTSYSSLSEMLKKEIPLSEEFKEELSDDEKPTEEVLNGPLIPKEIVYAEYKKWLHLPDTNILDIMFGSILANRLDGDPLWMFIVAPSGGTKTELILSISDSPQVCTTTTLTPSTLVSGASYAGGADPSLIPRLNGKILVIKDFTTVLSMNETKRDEIFGILRDAYDGQTEKIFGNGVHRKFASKFGILAGVTPAIDMFTEGQTALGERFLRHRAKISEDHEEQFEYIRRAMGNVSSETSMKSDLRSIGSAVLRHNYTTVPKIPKAIENRLVVLARWTAVMRSTVVRDKFSKELQTLPFTELGTRLVKQFKKLLLGTAQFRNESSVSDHTYSEIRDTALDSIPKDLERICRYLAVTSKYDFVDNAKVSDGTKIPSDSCRRKLENLLLIGVLERRKVGMSFEYRIHPKMKPLFKEGCIYE